MVVDPSPGMLARRAAAVRAVGGRAERLSVASGAAQVVLFHMSLHHTRWQEALGEAARVLCPGGRVGIWTMGQDDTRHTFLARWFPSVPAIERSRFPDPNDLAGALRRVGFVDVATGRDVERVTRTAGEWRAAVEAQFVSTLQLIDPAELAAGLAAFSAAHPDPAEEVRYERRFTTLEATRGPLA